MHIDADPAVPLLGVYLREIIAHIYEDPCWLKFTLELFRVAGHLGGSDG